MKHANLTCWEILGEVPLLSSHQCLVGKWDCGCFEDETSVDQGLPWQKSSMQNYPQFSRRYIPLRFLLTKALFLRAKLWSVGWWPFVWTYCVDSWLEMLHHVTCPFHGQKAGDSSFSQCGYHGAPGQVMIGKSSPKWDENIWVSINNVVVFIQKYGAWCSKILHLMEFVGRFTSQHVDLTSKSAKFNRQQIMF